MTNMWFRKPTSRSPCLLRKQAAHNVSSSDTSVTNSLFSFHIFIDPSGLICKENKYYVKQLNIKCEFFSMKIILKNQDSAGQKGRPIREPDILYHCLW